MVNKSSLAKKLASYSAIAAAVFAVEKNADAQIVYTAVNPPFVGHDTTYLLDLNGDGIIDFKIVNKSAHFFRTSNSGQTSIRSSGSYVDVTPYENNQVVDSPFEYGRDINSKLQSWNSLKAVLATTFNFLSSTRGAPNRSFFDYKGPWIAVDSGYLPLKFNVTGQTYYGWVRLKVGSSHGLASEFTVFGYAYNSVPGDSIEAGYTGCSTLPVTPAIKQDGDTLISSTAINYQWYYNGIPLVRDTSEFILPPDSGYYSVRTTDSNGCLSQSIALYDTMYLSYHVWPGDANEDLVVNNLDLLPIGLYYGLTGPPRDTTTIAWAPHIAPEWDSTQTNGMNMKFVDCNGDGIINSDDTMAVSVNYGLTHPYDSPRQSPQNTTGTIPLYFIPDSVKYHSGSKVHMQVLLGNNANPATIYGIAYDIGFDASAIQSNTLSFVYDSSFVGAKNVNAITLTHYNNDVETAVVGTDHINKTGYGKIGDLYFTLSQTTSDTTLTFSIINYEAIDAHGNLETLLPVSDSIAITDTSTGIKSITNTSELISVYPNPAKDQLIFTSNQLPIQQIQIDNVLGQTIYKSPLGDLGVKQAIDISALPAGMYFYSVTTGNSQVITGKFVKE